MIVKYALAEMHRPEMMAMDEAGNNMVVEMELSPLLTIECLFFDDGRRQVDSK